MSTTATHAQPGNGKAPAPAPSKPDETAAKQAAPAPSTAPRPLAWLGRRRNYLTAPRQQLPGAILATLATLFTVVFVNVNVQQASEWNTRLFLQEFPGLEHQVRQSANLRTAFMYVFSTIAVVGVFVFSVVSSHRTAGPIIRIRACMKAVQDGKTETRIKLRRHDRLTEIADEFNAMLDGMERRTRRETNRLEACVMALENSSSHQTGRECAKALREILDDRRKPFQA